MQFFRQFKQPLFRISFVQPENSNQPFKPAVFSPGKQRIFVQMLIQILQNPVQYIANTFLISETVSIHRKHFCYQKHRPYIILPTFFRYTRTYPAVFFLVRNNLINISYGSGAHIFILQQYC